MNPNLNPPTTAALFNFDGSVETWARASSITHGDITYDGTVSSPNGAGSLKFATTGTNGGCFADSGVFTPIDMTDDYFVIWVRTDNASTFFELALLADDSSGSYSAYAMWTVTTMVKVPNVWTPIALSWSDATYPSGAPDRTSIDRFRFRVRDNSVARNVWLGGVHTATEAAAGAVVLEFDDAHASVYDTVFPIMQTAGLVGTIAVIPDFVGETTPVDYMTWDELREMRDAGWDIIAHYQTSMVGNSVAANEAILLDVQAKMEAQGLGAGSRHFVYVGGQYDANLLTAMANVGVSGRTTNESAMPLPLLTPFLQRGELVVNTTTVGHITDQLDLAETNKDLLRVILHRIVTTPVFSTEFSTANFTAVVDYIVANDIPTSTVTRMLGSYVGSHLFWPDVHTDRLKHPLLLPLLQSLDLPLAG